MSLCAVEPDGVVRIGHSVVPRPQGIDRVNGDEARVRDDIVSVSVRLSSIVVDVLGAWRGEV